jgi:hypothetical protein
MYKLYTYLFYAKQSGGIADTHEATPPLPNQLPVAAAIMPSIRQIQTTLAFPPAPAGTSMFKRLDKGVLTSEAFYCWYVDKPYEFTKMNAKGAKRIFHDQSKLTKMGRVVAGLLVFADTDTTIDPPTGAIGSAAYRSWIHKMRQLGCDLELKLHSFIKRKTTKHEAKLLYRSAHNLVADTSTFCRWLMEEGIILPSVVDNITPQQFKKQIIMGENGTIVADNFDRKLLL